MQPQLAQERYMSTQVGTSDRLKLVVILYEGAISFIKQAGMKMEKRDAAGKGQFIGKALDIIAELNSSLNFQAGGNVARNLSRLYNFLSKHLTQANINWDQKALQDAVTILERLKDAWVEVSIKIKNGEVKEFAPGTFMPPPRQSLGSIRV
jgi:flagellar protein FliS